MNKVRELRMTKIFLLSSLVFVFSSAAILAWSAESEFELVPAIVFSSTRDNLTVTPVLNAAEIYLASPNFSPECLANPACPKLTNLRRLTENAAGDAFGVLSPDGRKIVFDSNRNRAPGEPVNTSDLFVMNTDGTEQTFLIRGSDATWSPDSKNISFFASASGTGLPIRSDPSPPTSDSDIFVVNVDDLLAGATQRKNLTNSPEAIDYDAEWSPDGEKIVFVSFPVTDDPRFSNQAEIFTIKADGTGLARLTFNSEEERAPSWSPDGMRIVYSCRVGGGTADFELCVMDANGTAQMQLTNNTVGDLTPTWSADGQKIVFHRAPLNQLFLLNADSPEDSVTNPAIQLTAAPGLNLLANWGELRVHVVH
jgi:TolB protein